MNDWLQPSGRELLPEMIELICCLREKVSLLTTYCIGRLDNFLINLSWACLFLWFPFIAQNNGFHCVIFTPALMYYDHFSSLSPSLVMSLKFSDMNKKTHLWKKPSNLITGDVTSCLATALLLLEVSSSMHGNLAWTLQHDQWTVDFLSPQVYFRLGTCCGTSQSAKTH